MYNLQVNSKRSSPGVITLALLAVLVFCSLVATRSLAATQAGTVIVNQASASYRDTLGVRRIATSNVVETVIRQVAAFELTSDQSKPGTAGQQLFFTHTLINTGNGPDSFVLAVSNGAADNYDLTNLAIYKDDDRDGQPDSYIPISTSYLLESGESQSLVIGGGIPVGTANDGSAFVVLNAFSQFNNAVIAVNTDTVTVTDAAVVELTKSISSLQGASPSGPFTVTVHYRNTGAVEATDVTLIDALPQGMTYQPTTGRWSESGSTVLTDTDPNDAQLGIKYCAYDVSCAGLPEANSDSDSLSSNQVTAIIANVPPGASGYVEFQVSIDNGLLSSVLFNTAEIEYTTGGGLIGRINSNPVPFKVVQSAGVVINGSNVVSVDGTDEPRELIDSVFGAGSNLPECQLSNPDPDGDGYGWENSAQCIVYNLQSGNTVYFKNTVWNVGNATDTFDITTAVSTFPVGTLFRILQADGQTPLLDTTGNGIVDTGPLAVGSSYEIVLQVLLPAGTTGDNGGAFFEVSTIASSADSASVSNSMLNRLRNITAGSIDITNVAEVGSSQAIGVGPGPEAAPVSSVGVVPGETVAVDLFVNNTSSFPMDFDLSASIHSDFLSIELPDQWQLQFTLADNSVVVNTGVIAPGEFVLVQASLTVPAQATPQAVSIYFKAENDRYAVADIKHDQVIIAGQESVFLGINQEAQTQAGGTHVYSHSLVNSGTTDVNNIALSVADSLASEGWSSLIYEDTDGDGALSAADITIGVTQLQAGESKTLFVKVFAPGTAADSESNFSLLSASWGTESLSVTDITNISSGEISVTKEQALDNGCDGALDSAYTKSAFSVEPGNNCVRYRLTAINSGSQAVMNVVVADATPTFTSYFGSAVCSQANCSLAEPTGGDQGDIVASLPTLASGESVVVEFMVRID